MTGNPEDFTKSGEDMAKVILDCMQKASQEGTTANDQINVLALAAANLIAHIDDGRHRKSAQDYFANRSRVYIREFRKEGVSGAILRPAGALQ